MDPQCQIGGSLLLLLLRIFELGTTCFCKKYTCLVFVTEFFNSYMNWDDVWLTTTEMLRVLPHNYWICTNSLKLFAFFVGPCARKKKWTWDMSRWRSMQAMSNSNERDSCRVNGCRIGHGCITAALSSDSTSCSSYTRHLITLLDPALQTKGNWCRRMMFQSSIIFSMIGRGSRSASPLYIYIYIYIYTYLYHDTRNSFKPFGSPSFCRFVPDGFPMRASMRWRRTQFHPCCSAPNPYSRIRPGWHQADVQYLDSSSVKKVRCFFLDSELFCSGCLRLPSRIRAPLNW